MLAEEEIIPDVAPEGEFTALGLSEPITRALSELGYESPTPIQRQTIPLLLSGRDVVGQAQTGTGKTAAFALPVLQQLNLNLNAVQALILTPTRELALQVAEAIHAYARHLGRVRALPVYGGQPIQAQLTRLRSGMQIIVGTPGRVMDHLRRGTLDLEHLKTVVLDEGDEMLQMGFVEDIEWILGEAPDGVQKALFSATMPAEIRAIADRYLQDPATVQTVQRTLTVPTVDQRYVLVPESAKLESLAQILELEAGPGEGVLVFTRTKTAAAELAERLNARGYAAEALHGDLNQAQRENVIRRLRTGQLDLVTATDVAARGLDVERIGLVVNYHMPYDPEWYVHRIGRTARAGRAGRAVLFVTPREQRLLKDIERFTGQKIKASKLPTRADVAERRVALFKQQIVDTLESDDLDLYLNLVGQVVEETGRDMAEVAAAAARLARGDKPLTLTVEEQPADLAPAEDGMVRLVIDAGREQGVRAGDIVGAIANEADIPGKAIGAIDIYDTFTFVEVPQQYRDQVLAGMAGTTIRHLPVNVRLAVARDVAEAPARPQRPPRPPRPSHNEARRPAGAPDRPPARPRHPVPEYAQDDRYGRDERRPHAPARRGPTSRPSGAWKPRPGGKPERPPRKK
jgi:ATP-dependent RNA helicase DeaD